MSQPPVERAGGSRAVQGCLIGAVLLFIVLLVVMIILGYRQFREHTATPPAATSHAPVEPASDDFGLSAAFTLSGA